MEKKEGVILLVVIPLMVFCFYYVLHQRQLPLPQVPKNISALSTDPFKVTYDAWDLQTANDCEDVSLQWAYCVLNNKFTKAEKDNWGEHCKNKDISTRAALTRHMTRQITEKNICWDKTGFRWNWLKKNNVSK